MALFLGMILYVFYAESGHGIWICARVGTEELQQFPCMIQSELSVEPAIGWCRLPRIATPV